MLGARRVGIALPALVGVQLGIPTLTEWAVLRLPTWCRPRSPQAGMSPGLGLWESRWGGRSRVDQTTGSAPSRSTVSTGTLRARMYC